VQAPMVGLALSHTCLTKEKIMTKITALDLSPFYRNSIGVDRLFGRIMDQIDHSSNTNYPPYNILKTGDDTFEIQVAVAGFAPGEIDVQVKDGELIITGEQQLQDTSVAVEYLHQGISARRFLRTFTLADYVEVTSAISRDGILTVMLERHIPEAMKPKTIAISYES
jgi:molecular chaperone IbpA